MRKNQQMIKLFVVLFFSTAFIFSFTHYGAKAFEKITNADGKFSVGTTIGALDISGMTDDEVKSLLQEKYVQWLKDFSILLQYGEKTATFDVNQFHLDALQTVDSIKDGQKNTAFITVDKLQVEEQIEILFSQIKTNEIDLDKLTTSLNSAATIFEAGSQTFDLHTDFYLAHSKKDAVLNTAIITMDEVPLAMETIIVNNPEINISEMSTFSLLDFAEKQKIDDSDSLNLIATGIYQAILPSNFSIVERNISTTLPSYSPLGYEAKVNSSKKVDLVISNPNKAKYIIKFTLVDKQLTVTLEGEELVYKYKTLTKDEQKLKPKTIIQYSPLLLPGKIEVKTKGEEGQIIKVYREIYQGDQFIKSELISEDYYPPSYHVEIHRLPGSGQAGTQTTDNTSTQVDNGDLSEEMSNPDGTETTTISDDTQQYSNDNDLWGKPNEQPK